MQVALLQGLPLTATPAAPRQEGAACPLPPRETWKPEDFGPLGVLEEQKLQQALADCRAALARPYYDAAADGADREAYYKGLSGSQSPADFYHSLNDLVTRTHAHSLDYDPSHNLYPVVDLHPDGRLHSIYSGRSMAPEEVIRHDFAVHRAHQQQRWALMSLTTLSATQVGERIASLDANLPYNCEHVVPQSWFDKKSPMRGDLHHLFACDPGCNSMRGDVPYADDGQGAEKSMPDCGSVTKDQKHFMPSAGRGAVARATLYFLLRYPGIIGKDPDQYKPSDIQTLLRWSRDNPVTDYERHRNAEIFHLQGNRNPLVDHPEWADKIDFKLGEAA